MEDNKDKDKNNNFKLFMYVFTKIGMFYCIYEGNWLALFGFTIATIYAYIEFVFEDKKNGRT
jgi:hypothetical protein